jgi:hypothetical protein
MVKLKIVRTDGTIIEAEGPAEELLKLNLIPWQLYQPYQPLDLVGGTALPPGLTFTVGGK